MTENKTGTNFFSSGLRNKVDGLMDILFAGGVNNPMDSIEQLSFLLFLRLLSEKDEQFAALSKTYKRIFSGQWVRFSWGNFVPLTGDELFNTIRDAIERLHELPGLSETGRLLFSRATLKIYDRPTLRAVVQGIHQLDLRPHQGVDLKGDMYEYLLSKLQMSGTNGQFRTPRHIIDMIVTLVDPKPGQRICDPACGTAGFLISVYNHILRQNTSKTDLEQGRITGDLLKPKQFSFLEEEAFTGYDNDANMVKIAILNLYLHRLEKADIRFFNPLTTNAPRGGGSYPGELFDVVLANPPFAGKIQQESVLSDLNAGLDTRATELLFLKWFIDHLAPGGRAGVIVPNGVLFGVSNAAKKLRQTILTDCNLQAVVCLPSGVFRPYAGVATAALIFEKAKTAPDNRLTTESVWFYELTSDGYSLDDRRTPVAVNDIPDALAKWPERGVGPNSLIVDIETLKANDWSLAIGRYKSAPGNTDIHTSPEVLLNDILVGEQQIHDLVGALLDDLKKP